MRHSTHNCVSRWTATLLALLLWGPAQTRADSHYWVGGPIGAWSIPYNWSLTAGGLGGAGQPEGGDWAWIISDSDVIVTRSSSDPSYTDYLAWVGISGTGSAVASVIQSANDLPTLDEYIGINGGKGSYYHSSGDHYVMDTLALGNEPGGVGTYTINDAFAYARLYVGTLILGNGDNACGVFNNQKGYVVIGHQLALGANSATARGTYNFIRGDIEVYGNDNNKLVIIGRDGAGTFNHTGGLLELEQGAGLRIGYGPYSSGTYIMSGGSTRVEGETIVGMPVGGAGTLIISDNMVDMPYLGFEAAGGFTVQNTGWVSQSGGMLLISGGSFTINGGYFNMTGGTLLSSGNITVNGGCFNKAGGTMAIDPLHMFQVDGGGSATIHGSYLIPNNSAVLVTEGTFTATSELSIVDATGILAAGGTSRINGGYGNRWGDGATARAQVNFSQGAVGTFSDSFLGRNGGIGTIDIYAGGHLNLRSLYAGYYGGHGIINLTGAGSSLSMSWKLYLGTDTGTATLNQTGGVGTVSGDVFISTGTASLGTLSVSGGSFNAGDTTYIGGSDTGAGNDATLSISGTGVYNAGFNYPGTAIRIYPKGHLVHNGGTLNLMGDFVVDGGRCHQIAGLTAIAAAMVVEPRGIVNFDGGSLSVNTLSVSTGGAVLLSAGGGKVLKTQSLAIAKGGLVDLADNDMIIDYTGSGGTLENNLRVQLLSGLLASSAAGGRPARRLGYGDNAILGRSSFDGIPVDATTLLIMFGYAGDANLDGQVDISDLARLATAWQKPGFWTAGDFNYDGFVDVSDLGLLATNWQAGVGAPLSMTFEQALASVGLGGVQVPEPSALLMPATIAGLIRRRRTG